MQYNIQILHIYVCIYIDIDILGLPIKSGTISVYTMFCNEICHRNNIIFFIYLFSTSKEIACLQMMHDF